MIEVKELYKSYQKGKVPALKGVTFSVRESDIFGVIGPDGAGKSSLFRILASLLLPDAGVATVNGLNVVKKYREVRKIIGYMPGKFSLYEDLSVQENLEFFATIFGTSIRKNYHLIKEIYQQLEPFKDRRAGALSGGMKQKLALCCALIHKPTVLILDEPTTGVDPVSRKEFWDILGTLKNQGITILVSTAYMDEASRCDQIALIMEGSILEYDTPEKILQRYSETLWAIESSSVAEHLRRLRQLKYIKTSFAFGDKIHVTVEPDVSTTRLQEDIGGDAQVYPITPTIEDAFMALIAKQHES
ncbi:MAG: ABC transporter ATP-binding protein [Porphyromonas sp.]|nr:ABC transporter ATP-binding protein [Porphyromonas sp.]